MDRFYLSEAFKELRMLNEEAFDITKDIGKLDQLREFVEDDVDAPVEDVIIDTEAEEPDDLQSSYVGKVILECDCCHSRVYREEEDIAIDEETGLANVDEECPVCNTTSGYTIIGKIEEYNSDIDIEAEAEESNQEIEDSEEIDDIVGDDTDLEVEDDLGEEPDPDEEPDDDDEFEEALQEAINRKNKKANEGRNRDRSRKRVDESKVNEEDGNEMSGPWGPLRKTEGMDEGQEIKDYDEFRKNYPALDKGKASWENHQKTASWYTDDDRSDILVNQSRRADGSNMRPWAVKTDGTSGPIFKKKDGHWTDESLEEELLDHGNENLGVRDDTSVVDDKSLEDDQTELITESIDELEINSEDGNVNITRNGPSLQVNFDDAEDDLGESDLIDQEMIAPLGPDDIDSIQNNTDIEDDDFDAMMDEPESDEFAEPGEDELDFEEEPNPDEEPEEEPGEEDEQDFDNESFNYLGEAFLRKVYENVNTFNVTKVNNVDNKLIVEGHILFNSGRSKNTKFVFEGFERSGSKNNRIICTGINETFSKSKKAFKLRMVEDIHNNLICEKLYYNYSTKTINESNDSEVVRVSGSVVL